MYAIGIHKPMTHSGSVIPGPEDEEMGSYHGAHLNEKPATAIFFVLENQFPDLLGLYTAFKLFFLALV